MGIQHTQEEAEMEAVAEAVERNQALPEVLHPLEAVAVAEQVTEAEQEGRMAEQAADMEVTEPMA